MFVYLHWAVTSTLANYNKRSIAFPSIGEQYIKSILFCVSVNNMYYNRSNDKKILLLKLLQALTTCNIQVVLCTLKYMDIFY